jgi:hypothetical protein
MPPRKGSKSSKASTSKKSIAGKKGGAAKQKRAPSGYNLYIRDNKKMMQGGNQRSGMSELAAQWSSLSQKEKDKYNSRAKSGQGKKSSSKASKRK